MGSRRAEKASRRTDRTSQQAENGRKALVLTEKPSVARDITAALGGKKGFKEYDGYFEGDDYVVSWAVGHLLEFLEPDDINPAYKRWRLADLPILPESFELKPKPGQKARLSLLRKLINRKDVQSLINACDAGREGELIFREIRRYLGDGKPIQRLWLQSMTQQAIRGGFEALKPGQQFELLGIAAECRAESDWLIGINATRALTKRLQTRKETEPWSVGRVQTPTLALLVDRELEILAHRSKPYWRVKAVFGAPGHDYEAWWFQPERKREGEEEREDWILDAAVAAAVVAKIQGRQGTAREERKPSTEKAPPPFDLTSLQREANRRFGYSASRTLDAAQQLYERYKLITYPRTDSRSLPGDYEPQVREVISKLAATREYSGPAAILLENGLQNRSRIFDDSGVSDHFAIMPTGVRFPKLPQGVSRIYDLVVRRFLAAFYPPALWENVERITVVEGEHFRTRARVLQEPGWQSVFEREAVGDQMKLPPLAEAEVRVETRSAESVEEESKPPSRISEAGLLRLMENAGKQIEDEEISRLLRDKGLGTPATRAEIIENLIGRKYVRRVGKALGAAPKGIRLIDILRRIQVARLASAELTGEIEYHLRQIERGERSREEFSGEIREYTTQIVARAKEFDFDQLYAQGPPLGTCPVCKTRTVVEDALAYRCEGTPGNQCSFRLWKEKQGRYLERAAVETLLREGRTPKLPGFCTRDGRLYDASLEMDAGGLVEVRLSEGEEQIRTRVPSDPTSLGTCPLCGESQVFERPEGYVCSRALDKQCALKIPARLCRREISREEAQALMTAKKTGILQGFISRKGRPFRASLVLADNGRIEWSFPARGSEQEPGPDAVKPGEVVDPEPLGSCPACHQGKVMECENAYACREGTPGCAFLLPRSLLGREIHRDEASDFILKGKTEILEGFISRRGHPFRAALVRKKNGKYGYQFPDRGRRAAR